MPTSSGPNTAADSNIIFSYDTADVINSYRGEPTTNLYTTLGFSFYQEEGGHSATRTAGAAPGLNLPTNYDYHTITTTSNWENESKRLIIWPNNSLTGSTTYYVSFWARVISKQTAQIGSAFYGNALNNTLNLTSQWQRFSFSSITNSTYRALEIGSKDGALVFQIAGLQIEAKSHVTPYVNGTRSATQGLVPLIGNSSLDLSNVSFDSAAQITFDGTNDYINVSTNFGTVTQYTVEYVAYQGAYAKMPIASRTNSTFYKFGDYSWRYTHGGIGDEFYHSQTPSISGYIHCIVTYDGDLVKVWRNGYYAGSKASAGTADFSNGFKIGYWSDGGDYAWLGDIPIIKIYNTSLSPEQVKQNYQKYKSRFNLS